MSINQIESLKEISIFDKEVKIAQQANYTTLFLENKRQLPNALEIVEQFSCVPGLKVYILKCLFQLIMSVTLYIFRNYSS